MKLSFVISTQPTQFQAVAFDPSFEANVARLAELGYNGIELAVREPSKLDVAAVKHIIEKHKLHVPAIGTGQAYVEEHLSFTDPDESVRERAIARLKTHIRLASEFHAMVILGLIRGKVQPNVVREQAYEWLVAALEHVARDARVHDVRLALEPINRYETDLINTVAEARALIKDAGTDAEHVGILFDTFHANIEEPQQEASLHACGRHLFHLHLADSNRWYPGAGHTNFASVIHTLREMKYTRWLSAEILQKPDLHTAAEQTIKTLKPLL